MKKVNVYDFDGTIYDGDSSVDFFKFAISKKWYICFRVIPISGAALLYFFKIRNKEYFKSKFFSFVKNISDVDSFVKEFWDKNEKKIKHFYLKEHNNSDYIVSASPDFLLREIAKRLDFNLIATEVDPKTGKLKSKNCHGEEKVKKIKSLGIGVEKFYSDSLADTPMSKIAEHSFMVKGDKIIPWDKNS
ncbi:HAD-IB family phosphatase [bacterium]|nr:HAD-IB family phosphatase [bacterium]